VSRHLHCDTLRNAGADEIADGGSAEVVQDPARTSSFHTRRSEGDPKAFDGAARTVEYPRADHLPLTLEILSHRSLLFKQFAEVSRHWERSTLPILSLPLIEP